jgi:hypothetical protein
LKVFLNTRGILTNRRGSDVDGPSPIRGPNSRCRIDGIVFDDHRRRRYNDRPLNDNGRSLLDNDGGAVRYSYEW